MEIKPLKLDGTYLLSAPRMTDERGYFMRSYDREAMVEAGLITAWTQESLSFNRIKGTLRGMHFQTPPMEETKIVRVLAGRILDVFLDLRSDSPTYGKWDAVELSESDGRAVYIAAGFAHGFITREPNSLIEYKIDKPYSPEHAGGIRWNDPDVAVGWDTHAPIVSQRDESLPTFRDFRSPFKQNQ